MRELKTWHAYKLEGKAGNAAFALLIYIALAGGFGPALGAGGEGSGETLSPGHLRVWEVREDTFDYLFASWTKNGGGEPVICINHRNGRTFFVKEGGKIGEYTVTAFKPGTEKVFKPTINSYQTKETGTVTLTAPGKEPVTLEQGKPAPMPGLRARIVSITTGMQWAVREGSVISDGNVFIEIENVTETGVTAGTGEEAEFVAKASGTERSLVTGLWRRRAEEAERREVAERREGLRQRVLRRRMAEVKAGAGQLAAGRVRGTADSPSTLTVGTEYRYPVEYEVLYIRQADGTVKPFYIPKKFETRVVGGSFSSEGFSWTTVEQGEGRAGWPQQPRFRRIEYHNK
ncbi:MAG: hypothetical protein R6V03_00555 [Kiritimatiellia bacterium]